MCVFLCVWHIFLTNRKMYVYVQPILTHTPSSKTIFHVVRQREREREREREVREYVVCVCVCLRVPLQCVSVCVCVCERMNSRTWYERKVSDNYTLPTTTNTTTSILEINSVKREREKKNRIYRDP